VSPSTSAAGLSTRSGVTGQSDYLSAAPSASGSLPSELGRLAIESPSAAAKPAEGQPAGHNPATSAGAGAVQEASAADAAAARGPPAQEAAGAEVADSGAADEPAQSRPSAREEGEAPAAASAVNDEGTAARPGDDEDRKAPPAGSQVSQESQPAEVSEGSGPHDETGLEVPNGVSAEHSPEWQRQPKHVFVLTSAGVHASMLGETGFETLHAFTRSWRNCAVMSTRSTDCSAVSGIDRASKPLTGPAVVLATLCLTVKQALLLIADFHALMLQVSRSSRRTAGRTSSRGSWP